MKPIRGGQIFTIGPWKSVEGDPASPSVVVGVPVKEVVLSRPDIAGALLSLVDGRYAITGRLVAVGSARQLKRYARRRLRQDATATERDWYREVIGELSRRAPRPYRAVGLLRRDQGGARPARVNGSPRSREAT
jgi:cell volume regulation protein A